jgi:glutamate dehydrogenase
MDRHELIRLVRQELPIVAFDPCRLGPQGRITPVDTPGGIQQRNSLHNRIVCDAFIPARGTPRHAQREQLGGVS